MTTVREQTYHVAGLAPAAGHAGGDPSPWTARGVFLSMQEAARRRLGAGLDGMTVAVQGLGNVGSALFPLLHDAGARRIVAVPRTGAAAGVALSHGTDLRGPLVRTDCRERGV